MQAADETRIALVEQSTMALRKDVDDHEKRIRGLEKIAWRMAGFAAAGGITGGGVVGLIQWLAQQL